MYKLKSLLPRLDDTHFYVSSLDDKYAYRFNGSPILFTSLTELIQKMHNANRWKEETFALTISTCTIAEFKDVNDLKNNHPELFI